MPCRALTERNAILLLGQIHESAGAGRGQKLLENSVDNILVAHTELVYEQYVTALATGILVARHNDDL